jgi:hypothetical protein
MGDFNNPNENNDNQQNGNQYPNQPQYTDQSQYPNQPQYQQPGYQQTQNDQSQYPYNGQPQQTGYQQPQYGGPSQYQQPQYSGQSQYQQPNQTPGQYQQPYNQYQPLPKKNNGMAIASMVCGIVSILISCCLVYLALPIAIVGLILGILSIKNNYDGKGMAIAGLILCGITILLSLVVIIACAALGTEFWDELYNEYNLNSYY